MESITSPYETKQGGIEAVDFEDDEQVDRAMRRGVAEALREHKRKGHSVIIWRDGKVVRIPPEEIIVPEVE
jgi:hypothetical protein